MSFRAQRFGPEAIQGRVFLVDCLVIVLLDVVAAVWVLCAASEPRMPFAETPCHALNPQP